MANDRSLPLQVYVFNVGQGDNILIRLPDGSYGLIDFFHSDPNMFESEPPSITFLKHRKQQKEEIVISFFHLSHYHFDHIKGVDLCIEWLNKNKILVPHLWMPGAGASEDLLHKIVKILNNPEIKDEFIQNNPQLTERISKITNVYNEGIFSIVESFVNQCRRKKQIGIEHINCVRILPSPTKDKALVKAFALAPTSDRAMKYSKKDPPYLLKSLLLPKNNSNQDGNDISSILLLSIDATKLLLGGDAKKASIKESISYIQKNSIILGSGNIDFNANFVKVFHHGTKHSSDIIIWERILKDLEEVHIAISAGNKNRYNHPHKETIDHIEEASGALKCKTQIYATNIEHLMERKGEKRISDTNNVLKLNWPKMPPNLKKRAVSKEQKFANRLESISLSSYSDNDRFLGYCFEFDKNGTSVVVKKLIA